MKVGIVTPWHTRCGISTYSVDLATAVSRHDAEVYIARLKRLGHKSMEYFETLATRRIPKVDVVHIQHEYGLYKGGEPAFFSRLRQSTGITPVVTTMHSVGSPIPDEIVANHSDEVVVHNRFCRERYLHPCTVIPHGVTPREPMPMEEAKEKLGLKGPVVTMFGFIGPYKGYEEAIRTIGLEFPGVNLLVAGGWHVDLQTTYIARMRQLADTIAPGQVTWTGWLEREELPTVFGASDVCLYTNRYMTESGALLTAIGYGRCVLCRSLAPNREREERGALKTFSKDSELILGLEELLEDPDLRARYEAGARRHAEEVSWSRVAGMHMELYRDLL